MRSISLFFVLFCGVTLSAQELVILTETGEERDGLPILSRHSRGDEISETLDSGLIRSLLRLYATVQRYRERQEGAPVEPAYLLLSSNQGGFPRYGFYLDDEPKPEVAYVDLHRDSRLTGAFGAVDQIFPHELAHIFIRHLVGPLEGGGTNQVHAIGLKTDGVTAFNEGFAEAFQVLSVEDSQATPETAALKDDVESLRSPYQHLEDYRRELIARWAWATPARMRFLFWFSRAEDVLRYDAVKKNLFARQVEIPNHLLNPGSIYSAYLLDAVTLGSAEAAFHPAAVLLATEGVVSSFFASWLNHPDLTGNRSHPDLYDEFVVDSEKLSDQENGLLKLFYVFKEKKPQNVLQVVQGYHALFPEESEVLSAQTQASFGTDELPENEAIWLANPDFETGTTLFDQFRGIPRIHTFDLNAATKVDLMGVPGMSLELADQVIAAAPFQRLADLTVVPGMPGPLRETFDEMALEMERLRDAEEEDLDLTLETILAPFWQRALLFLGLASLLGGIAYRLVREIRWWRFLLNGFGGSFLYLSLVWILGLGAWQAIAASGIFWVPAAAWQFWKQRSIPASCSVVAAWLLALLPSWLLTTPLF